MSFTIEFSELDAGHKSQCKRFDCGEESLNLYLRRFAHRHADRDHLSKTYLALVELDAQSYIAGYYSICACSLDRELAEGHETLGSLPGFPVPGLLLARLAVAKQAQGQGLGRALFVRALRQALELSEQVGVRVLVTHALNEEAVRFYQRLGLVKLGVGSLSYPALTA